MASPALGQRVADLALPGGPSQRPLTKAFPQKGEMILQRVTPPLLETPLAVFDKGVFTPNDQFYVRWHWGVIPTSVDPAVFRLRVGGHVGRVLSLSLGDLLEMPRYEIAAVNQCSGNSRGLFMPRVAGAQWRHGAMGNALWTGVRLRDVLDRAGVKPGAVAVRFGGMDAPTVADGPDFAKSLAIDHARDGEVMLAFAMNGAQLPLLNGFPLRLVVPGWYSTYWVKMLDEITVLSVPDDGHWMVHAYQVPATPGANVKPGVTGFATVPITRMPPRSIVTNMAPGARLAWRAALPVGGIAFGGDSGVAAVDVSIDGGRTWAAARLGADAGKYSFRRFDAEVRAPRGAVAVMTRCRNTAGEVQPMTANWNPGGYVRGVVETTDVTLT